MSDLMSAFGNEAACERYSKFPLRRRANHSYKPAPSGTDQEGRFAIVTNVGAGCDGRVGAAGRAA